MAARLVEEQLERVGGVAGELAVGDRGRRPVAHAAVVAQLDAVLVQALDQRVDLVGREVELVDHALELGVVHAADLAAGPEQGG